MITLAGLAQTLQDGLNATLNNPDIQFHIWAYAGEVEEDMRTGNTVQYTIEGTLIRTGATNDANLVPMGANSLYLELFVPIEEPRTQAATAPTERVVEGQYPFLDEVISAVDEYFTAATVETEDGFTLSLRGAMSTTGAPQIINDYGNGVLISVGIDLTFVKGGINSRALLFQVDGVGDTYIVPFSQTSLTMSNVMQNDVQAGSTRRKSFASANGVLFSVAFPATDNGITASVISAVLGKDINVGHFVVITLDGVTYSLFMTIDAPTINAQEVMNIGLTLDFVEIVDDADILETPAAYQVGRFILSASTATTLTFTSSAAVLGYIGGEVVSLPAGSVTVNLQPQDYVWDEEESTYYVYLITSAATTVTEQSFEVVKGAGNA